MNLINKKTLQNKITHFQFPQSEELEKIQKIINAWQVALKDHDLDKTKETSVQGDFLTRFFEYILGYKNRVSGDEEWNLEKEPKNEIDSQEPDGSLGLFTKEKRITRAVIELKDARTSLDKKQSGREKGYTPIEQAYLYATKFDRCDWIIVSNFREIRLYNKHRTQEYYEKFDILKLNEEEEFKKFYFLLHKQNLIDELNNSTIDIIARDSTADEEDITKKFYKEYKTIRLDLLDHLISYNPEVPKEVLLEKTQKILDRLIFVMFCEDSQNLLPNHILENAVKRGFESFATSDERVWHELKGMFAAIDKGNMQVRPPINAYNGGLFKEDTTLDQLHIKDKIWDEIMKLSAYDMESDLNVNVLGHIFEQSISDLEAIKESISLVTEAGDFITTEDGQRIEVGTKTKLIEKKGKRKKDGIFYTPEYITRYIVENTVGKYLEEYPDKLEEIKILDPACGSGAFLNQAHGYLLNQYKVRNEQKALEIKQKGLTVGLFDYNPAEYNKGILLNNIFGVDLNPESVEITKLALWLKTASRTEPLQNLDKNVRNGNSIVDDPLYAGDKAFIWETEFKDIIEQGGFDVIVGNPPYVRQEFFTDIKPYLEEKYKTYTGVSDLYVYFFEKSLSLLKEGGYFSFIVSSKFLKAGYGKKLTQYLQKNFRILEFIDFGDLQIFEGATTYPCIITIKKIKPEEEQIVRWLKLKAVNEAIDLKTELIKNGVDVPISKDDEVWKYKDNSTFSIYTNNTIPLGEYVDKKLYRGIITGFNEAFIIDENKKNKLVSESPNTEKIIKPLFRGQDIGSYENSYANMYLITIPSGWTDKNRGQYSPEDYFRNNLLVIYDHLISIQKMFELGALKAKGKGLYNRDDQGDYWWELRKCAYYNEFANKKIVWGNLSTTASFSWDDGGYYISAPACMIPTEEKWLVGLLNSDNTNNFLKSIAIERQGGFFEQKPVYVEQIPVPKTNNEQKDTIENLVERVIENKKLAKLEIINALELLTSEYELKNISPKLKGFYSLGWNEFIEEVTKNSIAHSISKKEELQKWFKEKQKVINEHIMKDSTLNSEINISINKLLNS